MKTRNHRSRRSCPRSRSRWSRRQRCRARAPRRRHWSSPPTTAVRPFPTRYRRRRGAIPICRASGRATTRRASRCSGPQTLDNGLVSDRRAVGGAPEADAAGHPERAERDRHLPRRLRPPRVPADVAHRRSGRRPAAGGHARGREAARAARPRARSATVRSTRRKTSRSTTAASRAASSARSCASSTATATASCRRRAWWPSATR